MLLLALLVFCLTSLFLWTYNHPSRKWTSTAGFPPTLRSSIQPIVCYCCCYQQCQYLGTRGNYTQTLIATMISTCESSQSSICDVEVPYPDKMASADTKRTRLIHRCCSIHQPQPIIVEITICIIYRRYM